MTSAEIDSQIDAANREVVQRVLRSEAMLVDLAPAGEVIPDLPEHAMLHAGPPLADWSQTCGALRGAVIGTLLHESRANDVAAAEAIIQGKEIELLSAANFGVLATYGGVITRGTNLFVVENRSDRTRAYTAINEGRGLALRYGSHDPVTLSKYAWLEQEFAMTLRAGIKRAGGIDLNALLMQALQMGDDGHSRQKAASALFANSIAPWIVESCQDPSRAARAIRFLTSNEIFFLPLTMAAAKATMMAAEGVVGSTIVTAMAANGYEWGIQVSARPKQWFCAPVPPIEGRYFEGYSAADSNPLIGDSEIAETLGLGAFAMSGAPALARYMGGDVSSSRRLSLEMYLITTCESSVFKIPELNFRGTPTGIDLRLVAKHQLTPIFNTGIAHRHPGVGQIGAGLGRVPVTCCKAALDAVMDSTSFDHR